MNRMEHEGRHGAAQGLEAVAEELGPRNRWPEAKRLLRRVRVVYTDLDGTMMGPGGCFFRDLSGELTLRPARVLLEALRRGVDVVPVSGRSGIQMRETARLLGLRNYIAELGVQTVYDLGEEVVFDAGDFAAGGDHLFRAIMKTGAVDFLLQRYRERLEYHTPWSEWRECTPLFRGLVDLDEVNGLLGERFPGLVLVDNGVLPRTSPTLKVSEVHAYHLVPSGVSKEGAVAGDMRRRGFGREESVAVGDSEADLAFAGVVGVFFLVRNGLYANPGMVPRLQELDNVVVTEGFLNQGWAEAVELCLLHEG